MCLILKASQILKVTLERSFNRYLSYPFIFYEECYAKCSLAAISGSWHKQSGKELILIQLDSLAFQMLKMCTAGSLPKSRPPHLWVSAGLKIKFKLTLLKISLYVYLYKHIYLYIYKHTLWPSCCLPIACLKDEVLLCLCW